MHVHGLSLSLSLSLSIALSLTHSRFSFYRLEVHPDGDSVLVVETGLVRIVRIWVRGPHRGRLEPFAENLPCVPDNIRRSVLRPQSIWLGCSSIRSEPFSLLDWLAPFPSIRKLIASLLPTEWILSLLPRYGLILRLDARTGQTLDILHDPSGR
jgi:hypothetical protein